MLWSSVILQYFCGYSTLMSISVVFCENCSVLYHFSIVVYHHVWRAQCIVHKLVDEML